MEPSRPGSAPVAGVPPSGLPSKAAAATPTTTTIAIAAAASSAGRERTDEGSSIRHA